MVYELEYITDYRDIGRGRGLFEFHHVTTHLSLFTIEALLRKRINKPQVILTWAKERPDIDLSLNRIRAGDLIEVAEGVLGELAVE